MPNCPKCGGTPLRLTPHFDATLTEGDVNNTQAIVQFRSGVILTFQGQTYVFAAAQVASLSYSFIDALLTADADILYFHKQTQKAHFLLVYPSYEGYNI